MRIAIIGTGIAGNIAAWKLRDRHDITVYESGSYVGGHTNTIDVDEAGHSLAIDTGFIVFNEKTYPNFIRILDEIGQASKPTEMSFSVHDAGGRIELPWSTYFTTNSPAMSTAATSASCEPWPRPTRRPVRFAPCSHAA